MLSEAIRGSLPESSIVQIADEVWAAPWRVRVLLGKRSTAPAIEWTTDNIKALQQITQRDLASGFARPPHGASRPAQTKVKSMVRGCYFLYGARRWLAKKRVSGRGERDKFTTRVLPRGESLEHQRTLDDIFALPYQRARKSSGPPHEECIVSSGEE